MVHRDANEHFLEIPHVSVNVTSVRLQIDDGVADDLTWTVVGNVAPASGFVHGDVERRQRFGRRQDMRPAAVTANAERQHVRMLDEQEDVSDSAGATFFRQLTLQCQGLCVRHAAETPDLRPASHPNSRAPVSPAT